MAHTCHAEGCTTPVRPTLLMCPMHWAMVPRHLQLEVTQTYRSGQCKDKRPSRAWLAAAKAAITYVRILEQGKL